MSSQQLFDQKDIQAVNEIRCLCADEVQKAKSGHPGSAIGLSPVAYVLFTKIMHFDNQNNDTFYGRDRFILSGGHVSSLQYALLHLCGFNYSMDDLKAFRQLHSKTPGHPERDVKMGIEITTGPLGQGVATAVGMEIAKEELRAIDTQGLICNSKTYVICGDGDLQEGASSEACSLAGTKQLKNLIVIYDDNNITIDGSTQLSFSEDVDKRYEGYNWNVLHIKNGNTDLQEIYDVIKEAQKSDKPTLIHMKSTIGFMSTKQGNASCHGSPLGDDNVKLLKEVLNLPGDKFFNISEQTREIFKEVQARNAEYVQQWRKQYETAPYYNTLEKMHQFATNPQDLLQKLPEKAVNALYEKFNFVATRLASQAVITLLTTCVPELKYCLVSGSADLTPSCLPSLPKDFTGFDEFKQQQDGYVPQQQHYGIRELGMTCITTGITSLGFHLTIDSTFLIFFQYMLPAIRLASLENITSFHVLTHDSYQLGEDGCTHQPVEVMNQIRSMINTLEFRPADAHECLGCWCTALNQKGKQVCMCLSRQGTKPEKLQGVNYQTSAQSCKYGGYIVYQVENPQYTIISSGYEVFTAIQVAHKLGNVNVVSMPSYTLFDQQSVEYKKQVLINDREHTIWFEPYRDFGCYKYASNVIGLNHYGASAPAGKLEVEFGLDVDSVYNKVQEIMKQN